MLIPVLFLSIIAPAAKATPPGTPLFVRLTTAVGSYASTAGSPIQALVIAPATLGDGTVLPLGTLLSGQVKKVARVGLGIRHETASLDLEFSQVALPGGLPAAIQARLAEVDNARERVTRDGRIHGVRATDSGSYRVSGYVREILFRCELHARIAELIIKAAVINLPEPEIYLPAGTEMTLEVTGVPALASSAAKPPAPALSSDERADLDRLAATLPSRTYSSSERPSDLTNVMIVGSRDEVTAAFGAAGWYEAKPLSFSRRVRWLRAIGLRRGFDSAPMSSLLLNGARADISLEKSLNDVSKRHHIRLWKQEGEWQGQEVWIGAATHDVEFGYFRPGSPFTHKIAADVDRERDKVAYDLAFTGCTDALEWAARPDVPRVTENGTGDAMTTDARLAILKLNSCREPRLSTETIDTAPLPVHGGRMAVFARREILSVRNDLLRNNWYYRGYETTRWIAGVVHTHWKASTGPRSFLVSFRHSSPPAPPVQSAAVIAQ